MRNATRIAGFEGGGTKSEWVVCRESKGRLIVEEQGNLPASNLRLTTDDRLRHMFTSLPHDLDKIGVFLAGCVTPEDQQHLHGLAQSIWPHAQVLVGSDRQSGFAAAFGDADGIAVIAGTGSAVTGRRGDRWEKAGGWGQLLGDRGGGYDISVQALRRILVSYDLEQRVSPTAHRILQELSLNHLDELIAWAQSADKMSIARLAYCVFTSAAEGDESMREILRTGANALARYVFGVARRLDWWEPPVRLMGGAFTQTSIYEACFKESLKELLPGADVAVCRESGALGAAWLAHRGTGVPPFVKPSFHEEPPPDADTLAAAATESSNPRTVNLDKLSPTEFIQVFVDEEPAVAEAIAARKQLIAQAIEMTVQRLRSGGRVFYIGAGTSGRLGVLDASEIPPTFGAPPDLFQGIIAGGAPALTRGIEGAEDNRTDGALTVLSRGITPDDLVVGLTASGRTPFVLGALAQAHDLGAGTILLTCNPDCPRQPEVDLQIDLPTGPEILAGSTRLKAGTATKLFLNILSTGAMTGLGKVRGNRMIDLQPTNAKLRDRASRIVAELLGITPTEARSRLVAARWNVREALDGR